MTVTGALIDNGDEVWDRNPPTQPVARMTAVPEGVVWVRRPPPTTAQFSGVVEVGDPGVNAARNVQLRLRDGTVLETMRSDPTTGAFASTGWYPQRDDYELHVIGEDKVSRSFPATTPAAVQWNGNPNINPSVPTP